MVQPMKVSLLIQADNSRAKPALTETVEKVSAISPAAQTAAASMQKLVDATVGLGNSQRAANSSSRASDIAAYGAELDKLRARHNPLFATYARYKTELAEIRQAHRLGAISTDEMTAAISRQRQTALATMGALKGRSGLVMSGSVGTRDRNADFRRQNLTYQLFDIGQTAYLGMNPAMILAQQGPQIAQLYAGQGGMNAALKDFGSMAKGATRLITPLSLGIVGLTTAAIAGAKAYGDYNDSIKEVEKAASGLGLAVAGTGTAMEASAVAGASAAGISVKAARSMEAAFLSTGKIGSENFEDLISVSRDFGSYIGVSATEAGEALTEMFADPAKAAETLSRQYNLIDAATARRARNLAEQNRLSEAQGVLLDALPDRLSAAEQQTSALGRAWRSVATGASDAWDQMGQAIDRATGGVSQFSDDQLRALIERANRPGNRRSQGAENQRAAQAQAELDRRAAQQTNSAEAAARQRVNVASGIADRSGALSTSNQIQTLQNEIAALQSGINSLTSDDRAAGEGDRLAQAIEAKTRALDGLINRQQRQAELDRLEIQIANEKNPLLRAELEAKRQRLSMASQETSQTEIDAAAHRARNRIIAETIASTRSQIDDIRSETEIRARLSSQVASGSLTATEANRLLEKELALRPLIAAAAAAEGEEKKKLEATVNALSKAYDDQANENRRAASISALQNREDSIAKLRVEIALIGQSETVRRRELAVFEEIQAIKKEGLSIDDQISQQRIKAAADTANLTSSLDRQKDAWDRVKSAGENAIDTIFDFDKLKNGDFASIAESLVSDIGQTVLDLGVKNPLKNALLGTNYGTFNSLLSSPQNLLSSSAMTTASMSVNASMVSINAGGLAGGLNGTAGGIGSSALAGSLPGSGNVQSQIWSYFQAKGLQPHQIAGIMGNISGESAFNPLAIGDNGNSFGLFQHNGVRGQGLLSSLGGRSGLGNVQGQLDYVWKELMGSENGALQKLLASSNVSDATSAWMSAFERPSSGAMMSSWSTRLSSAEAAMSRFANTTGTATQGLGTLGNGFNAFGSALSSVQTGGGGGLVGNIFGNIFGSIFGGLFGGGSSSAATASVSPGFLFDEGGWTGPGSKYQVKGLVHADEVVWSKQDVARHGGVSVVEAMRLGHRGYADGGIVGSSSAYWPQAANTNQSSSNDNRPIVQIINQTSTPVSKTVETTTDSQGRRLQRFVLSDATKNGIATKGGSAERYLDARYVQSEGVVR
ncbi:phage tail tip lysozyme [uncultured Cohaesibacter sp.]|uniref:phage tail tip lysozyme n=1 Tax=uncultured Cohaesibacter sp. TaxID=1002546 RepID=UPI0029C6CC12|nr:phage tail tip lysozyme [uncultured Cohaesibacter sp.]